MKAGLRHSRSLSLAIVALCLTVESVSSGTQAPPPVFPPPATGGVVDPVFIPPIPSPAPPDGASGGGGGAAASSAATRIIVAELDAARNFCQQMPSEEYTIDCLGDALQQVAEDLPTSGDYGEARGIIADAASQLRTVARQNASTVLPTGRVAPPSNPDAGSATPLVPVARERLPAANAQALAILEEAETLLLRSAANSAARRVHYERISTAVGSNKVLLRSL